MLHQLARSAPFQSGAEGNGAPFKFGQVAHAYAALPEGTRYVELLVNDGGNGIANDVADWAGAGFVR